MQNCDVNFFLVTMRGNIRIKCITFLNAVDLISRICNYDEKNFFVKIETEDF